MPYAGFAVASSAFEQLGGSCYSRPGCELGDCDEAEDPMATVTSASRPWPWLPPCSCQLPGTALACPPHRSVGIVL